MRLSARLKRGMRLLVARGFGDEGLAAYDARVYALAFLRRTLFPGSRDPNQSVLRRLIRRGDVCLDIGANVGEYTVALSRLVGLEGRVFAFEPVSSTFDVLRRVIRLLRLRNVTAIESALDCRSGDAVMSVPVIVSSYRARLYDRPSAHLALDESSESGSEAVRTMRLDDFAGDLGGTRVAFVKCDVEGAELRVFQGATEFLAEHRPIALCEIAARLTRRFNHEPQRVFELFRDAGYAAFVARDGRLVADFDASRPGDYWFLPCEKTALAKPSADDRI